MGRPSLLPLSRSSSWVITVILPQSVIFLLFIGGDNYLEFTQKD